MHPEGGVGRLPAVLVALALSAVLAATTKSDITEAGNETSRLAAVQSIVELRTFAIEDSGFDTQDQIKVGRHFYSDKPLLLIVWLAFVYAALPFRFGTAFHESIYGVTLLGVGSFSVLLAWLFLRRSRRSGLPVGAGVLGAFGVVLTTWVFSYGTTVNNHTPAACLLFGVLCLLDTARERRWPAALSAGIVTGLLLNVELPSGVVFFVAGTVLYALHRGRKATCLAAYLAGFLALVGVMLGLDRLAYGTVLPAPFVPGGKNFPGAVHTLGIGGQWKPLDFPSYLFDVTLGVRGLFSHMPALLFAIPGAIITFERDRATTVVTLVATLVLILFFASQTGDYGGWAYGFRYLIPVVPLVFWYAIVWFAERPHSRLVPVFYASLAVGFVTSAVGAYNPWPAVYDGTATSRGSMLDQVRSPFAGNLLCIAEERWPGSAATRGLEGALYGEALSREYLRVAFENKRRPDLVRALTRRAR